MSFVSVEYLVFFAVVCAIYFRLSHRLRWGWLLIASYYFYSAWNASYLILIIFSTFVDYLVGLQLGRTSPEFKHKRRLLLAISIAMNLGVLFVFKYFNFFAESIEATLQLLNLPYLIPHLNVLLPVGISFYTFQSMSYTIDVYKQELEVEHHLGIFATFISFFPQLVAGPIERASNMLSQFRNPGTIDYERVTSGLKIIAWGMFKKAVIADRVAGVVNQVYSDPTEFSAFQLFIATFFFSIQIYCDFSGYSDIAIGSAKILGFKLMDNFRQPYFSRNIFEFWRRWHISLSTWFRDYLYIPLGGSKVSKRRWQFNLFIVFLVSGLWHGANWTFVIWGALHGAYLIGSIHLGKPLQSVANWTQLSKSRWLLPSFQILLTFSLVVFAWLFFRANSLDDAMYISTTLITQLPSSIATWFSSGQAFAQLYEIGLAIPDILNISISLSMLFVVDFLQSNYPDSLQRFKKFPGIIRWGFYYASIFWILIFGIFGESQFIYFQF